MLFFQGIQDPLPTQHKPVSPNSFIHLLLTLENSIEAIIDQCPVQGSRWVSQYLEIFGSHLVSLPTFDLKMTSPADPPPDWGIIDGLDVLISILETLEHIRKAIGSHSHSHQLKCRPNKLYRLGRLKEILLAPRKMANIDDSSGPVISPVLPSGPNAFQIPSIDARA